jgi:hypothetical protein
VDLTDAHRFAGSQQPMKIIANLLEFAFYGGERFTTPYPMTLGAS